MATYRARLTMPAAAALAAAPRWLRYCACALAFWATAASAQLTGINPPSPQLPNAVIHKPYSFTFRTIPANPNASIFWQITPGCLDGSGLTFSQTSNSTAQIQGVAQTLGTYQCTVSAFVEDPSSVSQNYTLRVVPPCVPPQITSGELPAVTAGVPYLFTVTASGKPPLSYSAMGLPQGLTINPSTGVIAGTTAVTGSYAVSIMVNGCGRAALQDATLVVNAPPPALVALSFASQPNPSVYGQTVTVLATASGGSVVPTGNVLLCVAGTGQFCAPPIGTPPPGTKPSLVPPLLSAPLDANGNATFTLTGLLIDTYVLQAYYGGDGGHGAASAGPADQFVIKGVLLGMQRASPRDPPPAPIPTLSEAALTLLALSLAGVAGAYLRRRRHRG